MLWNGGAKWRGAANAPAFATDAQVWLTSLAQTHTRAHLNTHARARAWTDAQALAVQVEITQRAIAAAAAHGKYPMFNLGIKQLNYTTGPWSSYVSRLAGLGLFRYYEGQFGYTQWMENAVRTALRLATSLFLSLCLSSSS